MRKLTRIESLFDEAPTEPVDVVREEFPLPTLEQRTNLYLVGVHGPRLYSLEERAAAREIVIGEITSKLFGRIAKGEFEPRPQPPGGGDGHVIYSLNPKMGFEEGSAQFFDEDAELPTNEFRPMLQRAERPLASVNEAVASHSDRLETPLRAPSDSSPRDRTTAALKNQREYEAAYERFVGSKLKHELEIGRSRRRWGGIAATAFVGCIFGMLFAGSFVWFKGMAPPSATVVADAPDTKLRQLERVASSVGDLNLEVSLRLMKVGEDMVQARNVLGARMVFSEAAGLGSASAAFAIGATFDPNELLTDRQKRELGNVQEARRWYQRAKELGSTAAQRRLDRLGPDH